MVSWRYKTYHDMYVDMAVEHYNMAQDAYIELMTLKEEDIPEDNELPHEMFETIKKNAIATICFSVMALESYINTAAAGYLNPSIAEAIDRLDLVSKWTTVLYMATSIELRRGECPLQRLIKTVKYRNDFIHNKSINTPVMYKQDTNAPYIEIPELNPKNDFMTPAYDALLAIKDISHWIDCNWAKCNLQLWSKRYDATVKSSFKEVENLWTFSETYSYLYDEDDDK